MQNTKKKKHIYYIEWAGLNQVRETLPRHQYAGILVLRYNSMRSALGQ